MRREGGGGFKRSPFLSMPPPLAIFFPVAFLLWDLIESDRLEDAGPFLFVAFPARKYVGCYGAIICTFTYDLDKFFVPVMYFASSKSTS